MIRIISIPCVLFFAMLGASQEAAKKESLLQKQYPKTIMAITSFAYPHRTDPDGELEKGSKATMDKVVEDLNKAEKNLRDGKKKEAEEKLGSASIITWLMKFNAELDADLRKDDPKRKAPTVFYRINWSGNQWTVSVIKSKEMPKK